MPDDQSRARVHRGRIRDARGRTVTQLDPVVLRLLLRDDPIDRDTLERIVGEKGVGLRPYQVAQIAFGAVFVVAVTVVVVSKHLAGTPWSALLRRSVPLLYLFVLPFFVWSRAKKMRSSRIAAAMLKHRRCPHCGYDIRGLPVDPSDGAAVCPECACAWQLRGKTE